MFCLQKLRSSSLRSRIFAHFQSLTVIKCSRMNLTEHLKARLLQGDKGLPQVYCGDAPTVVEMRKYLGQFGGGSVDVTFNDDTIAVVTLNHKEKKNAISGKMMGDLMDAVEKLEGWTEGKAVILRGSEGTFCSGGDLDMARGTGNPDGGFQMATFMTQVLNRFQTLPLLTVALIEGFALGGGAEVSVSCDYRLMEEKSRIGFVHGRMGILPAWGGTGRLQNIVGYRQTLRILMQAKTYNTEEALGFGLIDDVIPTGSEPLEFTVNWVKSRTQVSSNVIRGIKTTSLLVQEDANAEDWERRIFAPYWGGEENTTALAANIKHIKGK